MQERLNRYWTERAPNYDDYQQRPERQRADREVWSRIWQEHLPPPPARVLDLGTGSGTMARLMARLGYEVLATDLSIGMLTRARRHETTQPQRLGSLTLLEDDAVDPTFPDDHVDAITSRYLMWTLRQPERALANWRQVLRPTGRLAVVDSTWFPHGFDADHHSSFRRFYDDNVTDTLPLAASTSIHQTARLIESAGFIDVQVTPLKEVLKLDQRFGVSPGHELRMQFMVSARNQAQPAAT